MDEQEAYRNTRAQAGNWEELRRGIVSARQEGTVSDRVKQIWLPGLVTFLFSYIVLALLQWAGMRPLLHHWARSGSVLFCTPWLLTLLPIGAAGAFLSRRAQGSGWRVYVSASLPALLLALLFAVMFPLSFLSAAKVDTELKLTGLASLMFSWVLVPGLALSPGAGLQQLWQRRGQAH